MIVIDTSIVFITYTIFHKKDEIFIMYHLRNKISFFKYTNKQAYLRAIFTKWNTRTKRWQLERVMSGPGVCAPASVRYRVYLADLG